VPAADWLDANDYPPPSASSTDFVWEFLRRAGALFAQMAAKPKGERAINFKNGNSRFEYIAHGTEDFLCPPEDGHIQFNIDCTVPLESQLAAVTYYARKEQERLIKNGTPVVKRHTSHRPTQLIRYLRILDAKEAGITDLVISRELKIGMDAVKDGYATARRLRDSSIHEILGMKWKAGE